MMPKSNQREYLRNLYALLGWGSIEHISDDKVETTKHRAMAALRARQIARDKLYNPKSIEEDV
jgi:hypothetical protein